MEKLIIKKLLFVSLMVVLRLPAVHANNIQVTNVTLTGQNAAQGYWLVQFDLSWENSWRTDNLFPDDGHNVGNWDAAWVFVKYRVGEGEWQHAKLHSGGHSTGSGTPATLRIGVPNEREAFHSTNNPGVGAFIYRSQNGSGTFSTTANQLRWNYGVDGVPNSAELDIKVFAIEMVYVAPGAFWLGSGGDELGHFRTGGGSGAFQATESWNGCIENTSGCLWGASTSGTSTIGETGSLHEHYPTGLEGFYSMKYSISQQQYVDFLNKLTPSQASTRAYTGGGNRNGISVSDGVYSTTNPFVANNFMSWMDGAAYMDWAGLRPMTELEYEKAARGPANPVANEYAWGSTSVTRATGLSNEGEADEVPTPAGANANYWAGANPISGPVRVGSFAHGSTTREQSGAGYWGIMELSGNLSERPVTVGNDTGRGFTGLHGNGQLTTAGHGAIATWPGGGESGITGATGSGFRGRSWNDDASMIRVSYRIGAASNTTGRLNTYGFRGVRSLPVAVGVSCPEIGLHLNRRNEMKKTHKRSRPMHFTDEQKHTIIRAYLNSSKTKDEIWRTYTGRADHGGLLRWMRKFGYVESTLTHPNSDLPKVSVMSTRKTEPHALTSAVEAERLNQRIKELEQQLQQANMRAIAFETMVEVAEKELGIPIRKKYATKPSNS